MTRSPDNFRLAVTTAEPTVLEVQGELDVATGPELGGHLGSILDSRPTKVGVDLHKVRFADARGILPLVNASTRAAAAGGELVLRRSSPPVTRLLALTVLEVEPGHSED